MAGVMTDYLADKICEHVLINTTYTSPTTVYLALFTTATTDAGGGTEVTGGSYVRKAVTYVADGSGGCDQTNDILFTNMPSCTVTHVAIFDHVSAGNMLLHGALTTQSSLVAGQPFQALAGTINILFD